MGQSQLTNEGNLGIPHVRFVNDSYSPYVFWDVILDSTLYVGLARMALIVCQEYSYEAEFATLAKLVAMGWFSRETKRKPLAIGAPVQTNPFLQVSSLLLSYPRAVAAGRKRAEC